MEEGETRVDLIDVSIPQFPRGFDHLRVVLELLTLRLWGPREVWSDITPAARRDFIHWITSPKRPETRVKRIETAYDMLAKGKRRPCCFDRSGMYGKSLSCPVAAPE